MDTYHVQYFETDCWNSPLYRIIHNESITPPGYNGVMNSSKSAFRSAIASCEANGSVCAKLLKECQKQSKAVAESTNRRTSRDLEELQKQVIKEQTKNAKLLALLKQATPVEVYQQTPPLGVSNVRLKREEINQEPPPTPAQSCQGGRCEVKLPNQKISPNHTRLRDGTNLAKPSDMFLSDLAHQKKNRLKKKNTQSSEQSNLELQNQKKLLSRTTENIPKLTPKLPNQKKLLTTRPTENMSEFALELQNQKKLLRGPVRLTKKLSVLDEALAKLREKIQIQTPLDEEDPDTDTDIFD